jgi:hypothetical protein
MTEDANPHSNKTAPDTRQEERACVVGLTLSMSVALFLAAAVVVWYAEFEAPREGSLARLAATVGLPLWAMLFLFACGLFLPVPFMLWHWLRLVFRGVFSEGMRIDPIIMLRALVAVPRRHPDLRISRWIVLLILGGYLVGMYAICHTDEALAARREREQPQGRQGSGEVLEPVPDAMGR